MTGRTGRCLCGDVQYTVAGEPLIARLCWCRTCQKISGNGTANAIFPTDALQVTGELHAYTSTADSGHRITRQFCPRCGCQLFARSDANPGFRVLRVGTLDDPSSVTPALHMWTRSAPRWACLDPALHDEPGQPAPPQAPASR